MLRAFAEMLTFASLPIWLLAITYTFVWRAWHFLPSFLVASLLVAPLLFLAIVFEHRDAADAGRPPRSFFPSPEGFTRFLFLVILLGVCCSYAVVFKFTVFQLPGGDTWSNAWARLTFFGTAILLAWQLHYWTANVLHRWFAGHVDDDWLESLGKPVSCKDVRCFLLNEMSAVLLVVLAFLAAAVVGFGIDWVNPYLDERITRESRAAKPQFQVRWLIRHPHTVQLFAATIACISTTVLMWKVVVHGHQKRETSHE